MTTTSVTDAVSPGERAIEELERLWGRHFEKNLAAARALARSLGPAFIDALQETGAGDDHRVIQAFAILADRLKKREIDEDDEEEEQPTMPKLPPRRGPIR